MEAKAIYIVGASFLQIYGKFSDGLSSSDHVSIENHVSVLYFLA